MSHKVALLNLGCRVNRVELDVIAAQLESHGLTLVDEKDAEAIVINTCAVTGEAEAKTRKAVRHAAHLPQEPVVVACGCSVNLFGDELVNLASNVRVEKDKTAVAARVLDELGAPLEGLDDAGNLNRTPTPTGRTRPGIKIQDGCDNRCSFCIVWKARGAGRSLEPEKILLELEQAIARGAEEVVLTGINLGSYDCYTQDGQRLRLPDLLRWLLDKSSIGRLRLSSIEPPDVTPELLEIMAAEPKRIAPFLHMCLQSGSEAVLKRMRRIYTAQDFAERVAMAREMVPGLALGTDVIVGFPGETKQEWQENVDFCTRMGFEKMHIFRYSIRPGTPAADMEQVDTKISQARAKELRLLAQDMRKQAAHALIGSTQDVIVEAQGRGVTGGLFDVALPPTLASNRLLSVKITSCMDSGMLVGTLA